MCSWWCGQLLCQRLGLFHPIKCSHRSLFVTKWLHVHAVAVENNDHRLSVCLLVRFLFVRPTQRHGLDAAGPGVFADAARHGPGYPRARVDAVAADLVRCATSLLRSGASTECCDKCMKWPPIKWAATNGHADIIKLLAKYKCSVDHRDEGGTALALASRKPESRVVRLA